MAKVFISYASGSEGPVEAVEQDLEAFGHSIWRDQSVRTGQEWWDEILHQIRQCDVLIFAVSDESLQSEACLLELRYARDLDRQVVPVVVGGAPNPRAAPSDLARQQWLDYRKMDREATVNLVGVIAQIPLESELPEPLPAPPKVPLSYLSSLRDRLSDSRQITRNEQFAAVGELEDALAKEGDRKSAFDLLQQLRRREDLLADVANRIDAAIDRATREDKSTDSLDTGRRGDRPDPQPEPRVRSIGRAWARLTPRAVDALLAAILIAGPAIWAVEQYGRYGCFSQGTCRMSTGLVVAVIAVALFSVLAATAAALAYILLLSKSGVVAIVSGVAIAVCGIVFMWIEIYETFFSDDVLAVLRVFAPFIGGVFLAMSLFGRPSSRRFRDLVQAMGTN